MTPGQAGALVAVLRASYPHAHVPNDTIQLYVHDLSNLPYPVAEEAIHKIRRTATFFPSIAEIFLIVARTLVDAPTPDEAFSSCQTAYEATDLRDSLHPIAREALFAVGGWFVFYDDTTPEVTRGQYVRAYKALLEQHLHAVAAEEEFPRFSAASKEKYAALFYEPESIAKELPA